MAKEQAKRNKEIYDKYTGTFSEDGRCYSQRELQREYGFKSQKSIYQIIKREEARRDKNGVLVLHARNINKVFRAAQKVIARKSCTT